MNRRFNQYAEPTVVPVLHSRAAQCARGSDCLSAHLTEPKPRKRIKAVCAEADRDGALNTMS